MKKQIFSSILEFNIYYVDDEYIIIVQKQIFKVLRENDDYQNLEIHICKTKMYLPNMYWETN